MSAGGKIQKQYPKSCGHEQRLCHSFYTVRKSGTLPLNVMQLVSRVLGLGLSLSKLYPFPL